MTIPTQSSIEQAKAYLRKRLNAEQSMSRNLETELRHFAQRLVYLLKRYGIDDPLSPIAKNNKELQSQIKKILQDLIDALIEDVELLSLAADDADKDFILALIHGEKFGMTLDSRVHDWAEQYLTSTLEDIHSKGLQKENEVTTKVGAGAGLKRLLRHTVAIGWMQSLLHNNPQAVGFYSYRGSGYPCAYCDSMVGFHPISEYPLGGWHVNCCCIFVLV